MKCRIVSSSMEPLFQPGDELICTPIGKGDELRRFDLIVFNLGGQPFCHFVWNVNRASTPLTLTTRSLRNPTCDDHPIRLHHIIGRVSDRRLTAFQKLRVLWVNLLKGTA